MTSSLLNTRTMSPLTVTGMGTMASESSTVISSLASSTRFYAGALALERTGYELDDIAFGDSRDCGLGRQEMLDFRDGRSAFDDSLGVRYVLDGVFHDLMHRGLHQYVALQFLRN